MRRGEEIAWAAGLFEGEGSITTQRSSHPGSKRLRVRFSMSMTDKDVVERFHGIVGCGTVSGPTWHSGSTKPQWRWHACRPEAVGALVAMFRPYLGKRREATLLRCLREYQEQPPARNFQREKTHCPHGHIYDEANTYRDSRGARHCRACGRVAGTLMPKPHTCTNQSTGVGA